MNVTTRTLISRHLMGAVAVALMAALLSPPGARAACTVAKTPDLPIVMSGMRPLITAKINDVDAQFILDSGAFFSMISSATAAQFKLRLEPGPRGLTVRGVGGTSEISLTRVKVFTIAGVQIHDVEFLVGGSEAGGGSAGMLGQNFLERWDVEYDFAKGVMRLLHAEDCKRRNLAYWVTPGQSVSMMDIDSITPAAPHTIGTAFINGAKIRVMFDTGADTSIISLKAAARAGVTPQTPGVLDGGYSSGIGRRRVKTYIANFSSFKIGDAEEIKNTRLRIGEMDFLDADMLVGADFFLSHHVYVANSQRRLYFTYNGGPVFNLERAVDAAVRADVADAPRSSDEPADAAAYARRGAASTGRRDYAHALADLTRACELSPNEAEYFYQRGVAYWENSQSVPAMADFNRAIELQPDYLSARMSRSELLMGNKDEPGAVADLDAADRIAPKQADIRYTLAQLYRRTDRLGPALVQYDLWITNHPDDSKMAQALSARCWLRALQGQELDQALSDCNAAYRRVDKSTRAVAGILDGRGLVRLRMGDYDKAVLDYDDSLKINPDSAWAFYGRGIAKIRLKKNTQGEADLAQASTMSSTVADDFKRRGISP